MSSRVPPGESRGPHLPQGQQPPPAAVPRHVALPELPPLRAERIWTAECASPAHPLAAADAATPLGAQECRPSDVERGGGHRGAARGEHGHRGGAGLREHEFHAAADCGARVQRPHRGARCRTNAHHVRRGGGRAARGRGAVSER